MKNRRKWSPCQASLMVLALALEPICAMLAKLDMLDERGVFRIPPGMSEEEAARRLAEALPGSAE